MAEVDPAVARLVEELVTARTASLSAEVARLSGEVEALRPRTVADRATIIVFSGDMDKLMSAFIIASGAVAMGLEASMYFTFWGLAAVKKTTLYSGKSIVEKMLSLMLPGGPDDVPSSNMNMLGMGPVMFKSVMKKHNVETLPDLVKVSQELGVRMIACQMSMGVMGIGRDELIDGLEFGGVATYLGDATDSKVTLYI
ncbi:MAG: DsrE/DsrF/DrsH-like family protein [Polyangiaceae bacterium]|nr:DsrE/DsrF/DrsH-like family protein [Polyangiaceae bacterium]